LVLNDDSLKKGYPVKWRCLKLNILVEVDRNAKFSGFWICDCGDLVCDTNVFHHVVMKGFRSVVNMNRHKRKIDKTRFDDSRNPIIEERFSSHIIHDLPSDATIIACLNCGVHSRVNDSYSNAYFDDYSDEKKDSLRNDVGFNPNLNICKECDRLYVCKELFLTKDTIDVVDFDCSGVAQKNLELFL